MFLLTPVIKVNPCQSAEKKKGTGPFSRALFHKLIFIDTRNKCDAGFFEVDFPAESMKRTVKTFPSGRFACQSITSAGSIITTLVLDPHLIIAGPPS